MQKYRENFPALANKVYFNFGGQGPLPQTAFQAIIQGYEYIDKEGPFGVGINGWIKEQVAATRVAIAAELNSPTEAITITENVTAGCNIALWGMEWQPGDRIIISDCEHPGVIATVQEICRRFGVEMVVFPLMETLNEGNPTEVIAQYLTPKTRLVVLSHLLWNIGQVVPLKEIVQVCHNYLGEKPVRVLVDAAQSVGCLPLNLTELEADFYAFTGHKWLCGPQGVGGLYVRPETQSSLHPTFIGWRGVEVNQRGQPTGWKKDGQRYEVATSAYPQYLGLQEAIAIHSTWGTAQKRYEKICQLSKYLWEELKQIKGVKCLRTKPPQAGLVSFQLTENNSHQKFVQDLEKQGFLLRTIADPDCIRACVHYFTLPEEIEQLLKAIKV
ncbi:MAG: aminotransferase class V-fold PLP-dependent enzyme [Spirulinaceae cyanobacterium]